MKVIKCEKVKVVGRGQNAGWNSLCFAHLCLPLLLILPNWPTHKMLPISIFRTFLPNTNVMDENVMLDENICKSYQLKIPFVFASFRSMSNFSQVPQPKLHNVRTEYSIS